MSGTRSTRNQPWCWQEKKILRLIRKRYEGAELQKLRNLYLTITEIDSDFNGKDIKFYTKTVSTYSGLSKDWIPKGLKIFEELNIVKILEDRENGKFKGKRLVFTPELIKETTEETVTDKSGNGKSFSDNLEPSEDILLLEDNIYKEDSIYKEEKKKTVRSHGNNFIEKIEKQFNKKLDVHSRDKIILFINQHNIDPNKIYDKSDYLRGLVLDMKPTLNLFLKEQTYINMSNGMYVNKDNKVESKQEVTKQRKSKKI